MQRKSSVFISRRETPWDNQIGRSPIEEFIRSNFIDDYNSHHEPLITTNESDLINSYIPDKCPHCGTYDIRKKGYTSDGIHRYYCQRCKKTFNILTNTIFHNHKLSIKEWIEFLRNLFQFLGVNADSWNNKNAFTTSRYWTQKVFILLENYQSDIILSNDVWLDETFYPLRSDQLKRNNTGDMMRGLSSNQMCIGTAASKDTCICIYEGNGKPSQERTYNTFKDHIAKDAFIIHDEDNSHGMLIHKLNLKHAAFNSLAIKMKEGKDNPMWRINDIHSLLKRFLNAHSSFNRENLQGFLDLFTFIMNPPDDKLEKIKILLDLSFRTHKSLKYREFYGKTPQN